MNLLLILLNGGMKGEPLPYLLRSDWMVTFIIFLCLVSLSYIISKTKKHLQQKLKSVFSSRERASFFDDAMATDIRFTSLLILQTCILMGFGIFYFISHSNTEVIKQISHPILFTSFTLITIIYLIAKLGIYMLVNWIFFEKNRNLTWTTTYFNNIICLGLMLLPILLLVIYFNLTFPISQISILSVIVCAKILLFWKCFNNFFNKIHGFFHLILYFCALEILPDLIVWKGILISCNKLILNI